jgi:acetylornithine deacetylase/succinyl-diaminopimelate desuccinylase-like protein
MNPIEYLRANRERHLEELCEWIRIPSISAQPAHAGDVARSAAFLADRLRAAGLETQIVPTKGHPLVYAERLGAPQAPTLLLYGHHDVQPVDPIDAWKRAPFEPLVEGDDLLGRGTSDDKGPVHAFVRALEAFHATRGSLPVSVKVVVEGEEESGGLGLAEFVRREPERLAARAVVVADTPKFSLDVPAICYGLRGIAALEIRVTGPTQDLHSGGYGGTVENPAFALAAILASCKDEDGRVAIPGFYDEVEPISAAERRGIAALELDEEAWRQETGVPKLHGEPGFSAVERRWCRPTFEVNGISGGYSGAGSKTIIPRAAGAKITCRLVPAMSPARTLEVVARHLRKVAPPTVRVEVELGHSARPVVVRTDGPFVQAAARALEGAYGRAPVFVREGGSIPIVNTFHEVLGVDPLLLGLYNPDNRAHSPNERLRIEDAHRAAEAFALFFEEAAETR